LQEPNYLGQFRYLWATLDYYLFKLGVRISCLFRVGLSGGWATTSGY
jgi:hypothetical protein